MSDKEDEFDIRNPNGMYEEGSPEHEEYLRTTPNPDNPTRNLKGHFLKGHSGNYKGKKKHAKSKVSTQRLAHFFRNNGVDSLEMIIDIATKAHKKGDDALALRASQFVSSEFIKFAINQENNEIKVRMEKLKSKPKNDDDSEEEDEMPQLQEVVFKSFKKASGDE